MSKKIDKVYNDIKNQIYQDQIFQYSKGQFLKIFHECYESRAIEYTYKQLNSEQFKLIDKWKDTYRTMIKLIAENENDSNQNLPSLNYIQKKLDQFVLEISKGFNNFRNLYDQHKANVYGKVLNYDESTKTIKKVKEYTEKEFYNRVIDKFSNKRVYSSEKYKLVFKIVRQKSIDFKNLMEDLIRVNFLESEIQEDVDFGVFKYFDLIIFCAALDYLCIVQLSNNIIKKGKGKLCISMTKDALIKTLVEITYLEEEKVSYFVSRFIYDEEYQKKHYTLFQPFFEIDEEILISPSIVIESLLPLKLIRVIQDIDKFEKEFSYVSMLREKQMIDRLSVLFDRKNIQIVTNYRLNNQAEYDILLLDKSCNNLWIIECKWFNLADNEKEHAKLYRKLRSEINNRTEKNKFLLNDLNNVIKNAFKCDLEINKVHEIIVSQNDMGTCDDKKMPIMDFETLERIFENYEGDFEKMWDIIENKKYFYKEHMKLVPAKVKIFDYDFETEYIFVSKEFVFEDFIKSIF